jgi:hypothetical protein
MSEKNFFERWSRLKREAAEEREKPAAPEPPVSEGNTEQAPEQTAMSARPAEAPPFDPASLPPIESITAASDLRAFLAPGVPAALTRAALRRAWVADPAIRDFVGLSENAWDFTAPESIPGFGSIGGAEDLRRLVAQLTGEHSPVPPEPLEKPSSVDPAEPAAGAPSAELETAPGRAGAAAGEEQAEAAVDSAAGLPQPDTDDTAVQHRAPEAGAKAASIRRSHGGALPQ